jgi:transaldolase
VSYVAPYVGRVSDWHKAAGNPDAGTGSSSDPGVLLARDIQSYYRAKGFPTKVHEGRGVA